MRKKLLYLGYQMGYDQPRNQSQKDLPAHEINKQNVSGWCESEKCSIRKRLEAMTGKELVDAVSQFEKVYQSFLLKYAGSKSYSNKRS
ncbi:hypothetical protein JMN32_19695 [Fulvivirga sp. 29W222]|uniref:Uncharacterized protein n=1 Tax=Fulvivirga marina TaxID=2494733 RepID=A0A937FYW3_9BACT|nr:hypothetical protein [Fulvivirga marina]MBL6448544.1 hypothetical protein [Fulvivirga marina]